MKPKDYINKKTKEEALKAFGATQLNNNQETSPYFVGEISADRKTIKDPTGKVYKLTFSGNPKQYELAQRLSDNLAFVDAQKGAKMNVDGNGKGFLFLSQVTSLDNLSYTAYELENGVYVEDGTQNIANQSIYAYDLKTGRSAFVMSIEELLTIAYPSSTNNTYGRFFIRINTNGSSVLIGTLALVQVRNTPEFPYTTESRVIVSGQVDCDGEPITIPVDCHNQIDTLYHNSIIKYKAVVSYRIFRNFSIGVDTQGNNVFRYSQVSGVDNLDVFNESTEADFGVTPTIGFGINTPNPAFTYNTFGGPNSSYFSSIQIVFHGDDIYYIFAGTGSGIGGVAQFETIPGTPGGTACHGTISVPGCPPYTRLNQVLYGSPFGDITSADGSFTVYQTSSNINRRNAVVATSLAGGLKYVRTISVPSVDVDNLSYSGGVSNIFQPSNTFKVKDNILSLFVIFQVQNPNRLVSYFTLINLNTGYQSIESLSILGLLNSANFSLSPYLWYVSNNNYTTYTAGSIVENYDLIFPDNLVYGSAASDLKVRTLWSIVERQNTLYSVVFSEIEDSNDFNVTTYRLKLNNQGLPIAVEKPIFSAKRISSIVDFYGNYDTFGALIT